MMMMMMTIIIINSPIIYVLAQQPHDQLYGQHRDIKGKYKNTNNKLKTDGREIIKITP
jgi:hypothetical protein